MDRVAAVLVIQIDGHPPVTGRSEDVVPIVISQNVATLRPIPPDIKGPRIAAFLHHIVNLVKFNQMLVAGGRKRHVGAVVDEVMGDAIAHSGNTDARMIGAGPPGKMMHVVVLGIVVGRAESGALAATHRNAAAAGEQDITSADLMAHPSAYRYPKLPGVADRASHHLAIIALVD